MPRTRAPGRYDPPVRPTLTEAGRERLRELRQELLTYYPGPMPRSRLVLMDVDPSTLHAYWSIDPDYLSGLRRRHRVRAAPLMLRLYELNGRPGGTPLADLALEGLTNNRYVQVSGEGRTYLGQLGLKTRRRFIALTSSSPLRLPGPPEEPPFVPVQEPPRAPAQEPVQLRAEMDEIIRGSYQELVRRAEGSAPRGRGTGSEVAAPQGPPARPERASAASKAAAGPGQVGRPAGVLPPARVIEPPRVPIRAGASFEFQLGLKGRR